MSSAVEARSLIEQIVGPVTIGTKLKTVLPYVAEIAGLTPRRVRGLWSGDAKAILSKEMDALRRARDEATYAREQASQSREQSIYARNMETLALLARRRAGLAGEMEKGGF